MRQIGLLESESSARVFSDFLFVEGIETQVEPEPGHGWVIWVKAEEHLGRAQEWLASYIENPGDPLFAKKAGAAAILRHKAREEMSADTRPAPPLWSTRMMAEAGLGPLTGLLMIASITVFIVAYSRSLGQPDLRSYLPLLISEYTQGLYEIQHGQIWRLITPIFVHFGFLHLFFNLWWLRDLGSMIEARQGSLRLALLVIGIGAFSNFAQFIMNVESGPVFGGMSGVVYGLIGYIWMRGRRDPASGLELHPSTVTMAAIWFVVCLIGLVPQVANTAHVAGAALGVALGFLTSLGRK